MKQATQSYSMETLRATAERERARIISGSLRGDALLELILSVPYRHRDAWTDALLGLEAPPDDVPNLPRGSVPYLPCGVDEVLTMVRELPIRQSDELVDLGAGLGRVAILVHLLSGARAQGIEIQAPLVHLARARCVALKLAGLSFTHADASEVHLDGSVFFLYSPFNGPTLQAVLHKLEAVARKRPVSICAVHVELGDLPWLQRRPSSSVSLSLYDSRGSPGVIHRHP